MTNKATGTQYTSVLVGLGMILLIAALVLMFRSPASTGEAGASPGAMKLALAQVAAADALRALDSSSNEDFAQLDASLKALAAAETSGLNSAQSSAVDTLQGQVEALQSNRDVRVALAATSANLSELVPEVADRANDLEQAAIMQNRPIVAAQLDRIRMLVGGLMRDVESLVVGVGDPAIVSQRLLDAEMETAQILRGFEQGDPALGLRAVSDDQARAALAALKAPLELVRESVRDVLATTERLVSTSALRTRLVTLSSDLSPLSLMRSGTSVQSSTTLFGVKQNLILAVLLGVAVILFAVIGWISYRASDFRKTTELQAEQTERNQKAIMRLLDELGSLADGDLTVKATVTEDITGAIADSINYAIEALRELVVTLKDSAIMVDGAAKQTDQTADQLAEASEAQSRQIEDASDAIMSMAASIEEVSGNAERSSDVARHSVDVAHKGGDAVRRTIEGMNTIRETIQDTAKRIKRLGESSQEIGNIVELINDIADQTNILALNASIQASMAGEAGRGFAVVADEVQRLAERSANATKQIEVLVRTIQSDTNEAVVSMERSTTDVVGGALLAENAGAALEEIEQVSNQIASLVQNISGSAREQSTAAAAVTHNMDRLQEINAQTKAGTSATTASIRELAELATQLRESVAGFRLPEAGADEDGADADGLGKNIAQEVLGGVTGDSLKEASDTQSDISFAGQKTA
jgi:twitching motility protein PilJ